MSARSNSRRRGLRRVGISLHEEVVDDVEDAIFEEDIGTSDLSDATVLVLKEDTRRVG